VREPALGPGWSVWLETAESTGRCSQAETWRSAMRVMRRC
jgi:hypothetical protein